MEWDGTEFKPQKPKPPPTLRVNASIMHDAHKKLGIDWRGSRKGSHKPYTAEAVTDTGCQTCTAGLDFVKQMGCPESFLVPTSHNIVGITSSNLGVIGSLLLRIEFGGKTSRQMVHISTNCHGLYLSEKTLMDLEVIPRSFPHPPASYAHAITPATPCCQEETNTPCRKRTKTPDRPEKIPFIPTKENLMKFEEYLLDIFASSGFNMCTKEPLQGLDGSTMDIVFKPDGTKPRPMYTPIPVPHNWKKPVKADLDTDVRLGIVEKVPQGDVSEWCSRMVVNAKKNGKPRRTVDLQQLNKNTIREIHHTPSPFNTVSSIPSGKLKTVLDAWNGYHSLMLSPESRSATTFITEWGRYRYCRGPQGYHGTGDAYTRRFDDITANEERYVRIVDDGCLWDDTIEQAFWHTFDHIKHCADHGVVFNREKFKFAREDVEFGGFEVTMDGYRPSPQIISSIKNFPTPTNITDIRSWFGLVNQVAYTFSQSSIMEPFRDLLKKGLRFYWDDNLEALFNKAKEEIIKQSTEGVRTFDMSKATCLATDWSKTGIGFTLTQKHCKCSGKINPNCGRGHWKLVHAGSRFTTKGEKNLFSPSEGECLAAVYGLEKCRMFTLGSPNLTLAVDHQPLLGILNDRSLDSIDNPRLLRMKERTLPYTFDIIHVPGTSDAIKAADSLSRHPVGKPAENDSDDCATHAFAAHQTEGIESITWEKVKDAALVDEECVSLARQIIDGFPIDKSTVPPILQRYWNMKDSLYVIDGVPFKGRKMLIPSTLRPQVLDGLHAGNQGVTGMLSNARERFFWPGLDAAVRNLRQQCRHCNEQSPSNPSEPMIHTPPPQVPFEQTVTDLCNLEGHTFLIYADRYSCWVEVERLPTNTFRNVKKSLLKWFTTYGVPEVLASDGGPPYNSHEFRTFLRAWDVQWRLSSAHYPQSNGRAEAAVKTIKRILRGNINPRTGDLDTNKAAQAILSHRNTPCQDSGISPAVMLFGRPIRDHLPRLDRKLRPEWDAIAKSREEALARRVVKQVPQTGKELTPLRLGDVVQVQNQIGNHPLKWDNTGVISEVLPNRQYHVVMDGSRRISLRNRRFLKKILPVTQKIINDDAPMPLEWNDRGTWDVQSAGDEVENVTETGNTQDDPPPSEATTHDNDGVPSASPNELIVPEQTRRGTRERTQRKLFSAKLTGKSHE